MKRFQPGGRVVVPGILVVCALALQARAGAIATSRAPIAPQQRVAVRWTPAAADSRRPFVDVVGLTPATLRRLLDANWKPAQWQRLLSVYAGQQESPDSSLPAMIGAYRVVDEVLRFEPEFPLEPGLTYRAVFRPGMLPGERDSGANSISSLFRTPSRTVTPTTVVSRIFPSSDILPENLLKFYVHFSAPMSRGHIYDYIRLKDARGRDIDLPFLEIDEELWDPSMKRLTLFIDPGRIKRGVLPLEDVGPALEDGKGYTLVIGREWRDGAGNPLKESFQKSFTVGPPDREPPDPARWKVQSPEAGTRGALAITFPETMDSALTLRLIRVSGESGDLEGLTELEDQERRWTFKPANSWRSGSYKVVIATTIEDLAGNNIGKPFDVDLFETIVRRLTTANVVLSFEVR
jgi:hypothetical protein